VTDTWPVAMRTGHRALPGPQARWAWRTLRAVAKTLHRDHGVREAICGMALGADQEWAFAAHAAGMALAAYIPFPQQPDPWNPRQQADWRIFRRLAHRERVFGDLDSVDRRDRKGMAARLCRERNSGMATDTAAAGGVCVVVWDGRQAGGTWDAVQKVRRRDLPVMWLDVATETVRVGAAKDVLTNQPTNPPPSKE